MGATFCRSASERRARPTSRQGDCDSSESLGERMVTSRNVCGTCRYNGYHVTAVVPRVYIEIPLATTGFSAAKCATESSRKKGAEVCRCPALRYHAAAPKRPAGHSKRQSAPCARRPFSTSLNTAAPLGSARRGGTRVCDSTGNRSQSSPADSQPPRARHAQGAF